MVSITELANQYDCDPIHLNKIMVKYDIPVKTEFGVNDGFVEENVDQFLKEQFFEFDQYPSEEWILDNKKDSVPIKFGYYVYFLIDGNEIVYVGQSCAINARIQTHIDSKKAFTHVNYFEVKRERLTEAEWFYISCLKPKLNIANSDRIWLIDLLMKRFY